MKPISIITLIALAVSCTTTHITPEQSTPIPTLGASCAVNESLEIDGFRGIVCTFENHGTETIRFKLAGIRFDDPSTKLVKNSESQDLMNAWAEAKKQDTHNRKMGVLAAVGLGFVAVLTGDANVMNAGLATVSVASSYDAAADINDSYEERQYGDAQVYAFGESILGSSIAVPRNLPIRKGFLVESSEPSIFSVSLCFNDENNCQEFPLQDNYR
ncbi:hypothetical protein [Pseudobacteriovorax antillogorgiicola]|uniref:Lipoprotein n=1 Tax=Pseudobacteriovorax antillogorgiicola TaxID=1513793 RepID=A0A1Y6CCK3_9BACT|nr:hypothetical protein [Pseudobacteriovorax antillogorgiicola]TCS48281.1 hypothetical protein EDD56_11861 [Pseudobacteriovorax antillogorgiicola]SMF56984.1 hypothetical protein SAMN06296036_11880 [Pseudobacteriovorax antillogorgiicola]